MAFHFCAHSWEVRDIADGTMVTLSNRDLSAETCADLVDDLAGLVLESGLPNLYLDFERIGLISSEVLGKLIELQTRLRERGGRLTLLNVKPHLAAIFEAAQLNDVLDIRAEGAPA
jgi:anti-anti-sigma factor